MEKKEEKKGGCFWGAITVVMLALLQVVCLMVVSIANNYNQKEKTISIDSLIAAVDSTEETNPYDWEPQYPEIDSTHEAFLDSKKWRQPKLKDRVARRILHEISDSYKCSYFNDRWEVRVNYPACFKAGRLPLNGDGCGFEMGHDIAFHVSGHNNIYEYTLYDWYKLSKREFCENVIYSKYKGNYFIVVERIPKGSEVYPDKIACYEMECWTKVIQVHSFSTGGDGAFACFSICYPVRYKKAVMNMIKYEEINFNGK